MMIRIVRVLLIAFFVVIGAGPVLAISANDSLTDQQRALLDNEHPDDTQFYSFADRCATAGKAELCINTYKTLLGANKKKFDQRDLEFLNRLYKAMNSAKPTETNYYICYYIAKVQIVFHMDNEAPLRYINQLTDIAEKLHDNCLTVKAYSIKGSFYNNVKHDLVASFITYEVIDSFQKANHIDVLSPCAVDINIPYSIMYLYQGDNEKAAEYITKSIRVTPWSNNSLKLFDLYTRRAGFEIETTRPQRAFLSLDSAAMVIRNTPNNTSSINDMYSIRFSCYVKLQDYVNATKLLDSIDVHKLSVSNDEFYDYLYALMLYNIHNGDYEKVKENIRLYVPDLKEWNILRWRNVYDAEYRLYTATGDKVKALESFIQYSRYNDSMFHRQQNYAVLAEQIKYHNRLKEEGMQIRINLLQKQNQLRQLYLFTAFIIILLTLVIIFQFYRNNKKDKRNIAELRTLNDQVSEQKQELELKNKEKDRIMDVVAHDLRSPVGGVVTMSDSLLSEDELPADTERAVKLIRKASASALELINELMDYSNETRPGMIKESEDIVAVAKEAITILQLQADEKKQTINLHTDLQVINVPIDKEKIIRVLSNLLSNAIKFSNTGSAIDVSIVQIGAVVQIKVEDRGVGIPAKYKDQVFDMFTALNRRGTQGERSFGLGLSITRQIVEAHGGRVWAESEEGKGSLFYVELPLS